MKTATREEYRAVVRDLPAEAMVPQETDFPPAAYALWMVQGKCVAKASYVIGSVTYEVADDALPN